jgi:hypothetical protein
VAEGADLDIRPARSVQLVTAGRDVSPEDQRDSKAAEAERLRKQKLVEEGIRRWKACSEAEAKQRQREKEDLEFARALPEDQWPEELLRTRAGGTINGIVTAARPCLVIPKLNAPVDQTVNEARNARLSIRVKPKGQFSNKKGAQLRQEMIRAIEVDSNATQPRLWALNRAAICGRGWYRVVKEYAADGDFLIDLVTKGIPNQGSVYCDPFANEPDKSDAEFMFVTSDFAPAEYKRRFPKSELAESSADGDLFSTTADLPLDWVNEKHFRVAEYFYVEHKDRILIETPLELGGKHRFADELPPELQAAIPKGIKTRTVDHRTVRWCLMNAVEILEEEQWEGRTIPIIPVVGSVSNVEGEWVYKGIVSNAKDAQRSYNYGRSAQVESVGLAPRAPWVIAEGQVKGYEDVWEQANTYGGNYLPYVPTSLEGQPVPPPQRNTVEPAIQAITLMVREADNDIKATTGRYDPSLGNLDPNARSGKALKELKQQGELGSSHFLDNLANVSMRREALIYLEMLYPVYGTTPGRIARLLGEEEEDAREVMLGKPFVPDEDGRPVEAPADHPAAQRYELDEDGEYAVVVSVGKSSQTQREDNAELLKSIFEAAPQVAEAGADIFVEQLEGPVAERLAKRLRKLNPALADEDESGAKPPVDPAMQQQLQQLQQANQQLETSLKQTVEELKTQKAAADAEAQVKREEIQAKAQAAQAEQAAKQQTAQMELEAKQRQFEAELAAKREMFAMELASKKELALLEMENDLRKAQIASDAKAQQLEMQAQAARESQVRDQAFQAVSEKPEMGAGA